jgi:hypothetical protein
MKYIKLKILSKIFISYGIFSIGLQSAKLDLSDIKSKPFMVATKCLDYCYTSSLLNIN